MHTSPDEIGLAPSRRAKILTCSAALASVGLATVASFDPRWTESLFHRTVHLEGLWKVAAVAFCVTAFSLWRRRDRRLNRYRRALQIHSTTNRRILDASPDGILMLDPERIVVEWNPALAKFTGIPRSQAIGLPLADVLASLTSGGAGECLKTAFLGAEAASHGRTFLLDTRGASRSIDFYCTPIQDGDRTLLGVLALIKLGSPQHRPMDSGHPASASQVGAHA